MKATISQLIRQAQTKSKKIKPIDQSIIKSGVCSGKFVKVPQLN